jgi:hypothetical protein
VGAEGALPYHSRAEDWWDSSSFRFYLFTQKIPYYLLCNLHAKHFLLSRMEITTKLITKQFKNTEVDAARIRFSEATLTGEQNDSTDQK